MDTAADNRLVQALNVSNNPIHINNGAPTAY